MVKISRDRQRPVGGCGCAQAARTQVSADSQEITQHKTRCHVVKDPWDEAPHPRHTLVTIAQSHIVPAITQTPHMGTARTRRTEQSQWRIGRLNMDPTVYSFLIRGCVCLVPFCCTWSEPWRRRFYLEICTKYAIHLTRNMKYWAYFSSRDHAHVIYLHTYYIRLGYVSTQSCLNIPEISRLF